MKEIKYEQEYEEEKRKNMRKNKPKIKYKRYERSTSWNKDIAKDDN